MQTQFLRGVFKVPQKNKLFGFYKKNLYLYSSIKEKIRQERLSRLAKDKDALPLATQKDLAKIRNIGIIAHIDAGKTTTTERMLFYAGILPLPGEVHDGNTVMDYLQQERERGITIRTAAISFNWKGFQFNLLDTPGHIDFTGEVERSLRVLDGAVAIFDAVSGVQTQSEMVWHQSNKFKVPRLAFINKMDRQGASLEATLESIESRLNATPLVLQIPSIYNDQFNSLIDVIQMKEIQWIDKYGTTVDILPVDKDHKLFMKTMDARSKLLETVAIFDDEISDFVLSKKDISNEVIERSIKKIINSHSQDTCAILLGSALKNRGIQPLMDSIIKYLPSPSEKQPVVDFENKNLIRKPEKTEKLCAYTYKIIQDPSKGRLSYVRVYSGVLQQKTLLKNTSRNIQEKVQYLYRVRANEYVQTNEITSGDIVAISGLKETQTGDTLIDGKDLEKFQLEVLQMPQPVFMASLEYESLKDKPLLDNALKTICQEDNSLTYREDEETGQILVGGLGELHLEILRDRLLSDFNLKVTVGKMRVTYRESIQDQFEMSYTFQKLINGRPIYLHLDLAIEPIQDQDDESAQNKKQNVNSNEILYNFERDPAFDLYFKEYKRRQSLAARNRKQQSDDDKVIESEEQQANQQQVQQTKASAILESLKFVKNPVKPVEIGKLEDEYGEETLYDISSLSFELFYAMEKTIQNAFLRGSLLGYPVVDVRVRVLGGKYSLKRTNQIAIEMCTAELMKEMISNSKPTLLEPMMDVEISTPQLCSKEIINDILGNKRGKVGEISEEGSKFGKSASERSIINSTMPLIETIGYSTYLRSISKGEASFIMKFKKFDQVTGQKQKEILAMEGKV